MLDIAAKSHFHFDAVQMPLDVMDAHFRSFEDQVLPVLLKREIGVEAMKTFGDNYIEEQKRTANRGSALFHDPANFSGH